MVMVVVATTVARELHLFYFYTEAFCRSHAELCPEQHPFRSVFRYKSVDYNSRGIYIQKVSFP